MIRWILNSTKTSQAPISYRTTKIFSRGRFLSSQIKSLRFWRLSVRSTARWVKSKTARYRTGSWTKLSHIRRNSASIRYKTKTKRRSINTRYSGQKLWRLPRWTGCSTQSGKYYYGFKIRQNQNEILEMKQGTGKLPKGVLAGGTRLL